MLLAQILEMATIQSLDALLEGVTDMPEDADLTSQLEILMQRLESAKRALGITNKLPPGDDRKHHRGRVMGFMNQLRAMFNRVANQLEAEIDQDQDSPEEQPAAVAEVPASRMASPAQQSRFSSQFQPGAMAA